MGDAQIRANYASSIKRLLEFTKKQTFKDAAIEEVEVRLNRLETVWKQFDAENEKVLLNLTTVDASEDADGELYADTEDMYIETKVVLLKKMNALKQAIDPNTSTLGSSTLAAEKSDERDNLTVTIPNDRTGLQLVKTDLPVFSGKPEEWPYFRQLFIRMVHENSQYMTLAKFNMLRQHLKGEALGVILGLGDREENYAVAWDALNDEYNDPQKIVNALLDQLTGLRALTDENPASLRYIVIRYKQVTTQLAAADVDVSTWDPLLTYQLTELLDPTTRRDWELHRPRKLAVPLKEMLTFLDDRVKALLNVSRSKRLKSVIVRPPTPKQTHDRSRSSTPTIGYVSNAADNSKHNKLSKSKKGGCPVCKGDHEVPECDKFCELNCFPRMQRARSLRLCFGCLKPDHTLSDCSVQVCEHCNNDRRHHKLLCFVWCDRQKENQHMVAYVQQIQTELQQQQEVLLATAIVIIKTADGNQLTARALCDSGAQANIITDEFANRLRVQRRKTNTSIQAIGEANMVNIRGAVSVTVQSSSAKHSNYQVTVNALITRRISTLQPTSRINVGH